MKRTDKKGFTIVELVIVIAVIAILAAVLIPNISKLVRKANESSDLSLVRNLNTALSLETKDYATAHEAFETVKEAGYDLTKIEAKADKNKILYDSENQCFAYLKDGKLEYYPNSAKTPVTSDNYYKLWAVCNNAGDIDTQFSVYWNGGNTNETLKVEGVGFDAGDYFVAGVEYTGTKQQTVTIRTNSGETNLTVNNDKATVNHYGSAGTVTVISVDVSHSYHEFGSVNELTATKGHIVFETGSLILSVNKAERADVTFTSNGTVINANGIENITPATTFDISTLNQLCAFRDYVNAGFNFSNLPIEIKADIDMSNTKWIPIGTLQNPFHGTIHGNNYTIKGLTPDVAAVTSKDFSFTTSSVKSTGSAFGLIGIVANGSIEVDNLNFSDVNIDLTQGQCVGTLIGYVANDKTLQGIDSETTMTGAVDVKITNVKVLSGTIKAMKDVGGIVGKSYQTGDVLFDRCSNYADIVSGVNTNKGKAGGIVSFVRNEGDAKDVSIKFIGCENHGNIDCYYERVGGIVAYVTPKISDKGVTAAPSYKTTIVIEGCKNTGEIVQRDTRTGNYAGCAAGIIYECYTGDYLANGTFTLQNCESAEGKAATQITHSKNEKIGKNDSFELIIEK